jgi:hypothetical protein
MAVPFLRKSQFSSLSQIVRRATKSYKTTNHVPEVVCFI